MQEIINSLYDTDDSSFFNYCGAKGVSSLISTISHKENIPESHIMITSGNTQGFELGTRLFLNKNDFLAMEGYTYSLVHSAVRRLDLNAVEVPLEQDGLDLDYLETVLETQPIKMLYIIPNAQNPTGSTLSLEKRNRLIHLAYAYDFVILEDDPYRDLNFGIRLPSLFELDPLKEKVLYLYSFSKTIAPTFRTGYILANPFFIQKLLQFKQTNDCCTSPLNQMIVNKMITSDLWEDTLKKQQLFYETRKDLTKTFLEKMNKKYNWTSNEPDGGMFYWVDTNAGDVQDFLIHSIKNGVIFVPGKTFALNDQTNTKFRLCYTYCDNKELIKGFERLEQSFIQWQEDTNYNSQLKLFY
jgi:2-aminoadipate transaminase